MSGKKAFAFGSRTHKNILKGKNIRKNEVGDDIFEDYWTDSDGENSISTTSKSSKKLSEASSVNELNTIEVDDIHVLSKTKILDCDVPNVTELNDVSSPLAKTFCKSTKSPATSKRVTRSTPNDGINNNDELSKTNTLKYDSPGKTTKANLEDAVANLVSKTFNKKKKISKTPKRNLRNTSDIDFNLKTKTNNCADVVDNPQDGVYALSKTHETLSRQISVKSTQNSELSNATTSKKVMQLLAHYDDYDSMIMEMIHNDADQDGVLNSPSSINNNFSNQKQNTTLKQTESNTSKQTLEASERNSRNFSDENDVETTSKSPTHQNKIITRPVYNNSYHESHSEVGVLERQSFESVPEKSVSSVTHGSNLLAQSKKQKKEMSTKFKKQENNTNLVHDPNLQQSSVESIEKCSETVHKSSDKNNLTIKSTLKKRKAVESDSNNISDNENNLITLNKKTMLEKNIASDCSKKNESKQMLLHLSPVHNSMNSSNHATEDVPAELTLAVIPEEDLPVPNEKQKEKIPESVNQLSSTDFLNGPDDRQPTVENMESSENINYTRHNITKSIRKSTRKKRKEEVIDKNDDDNGNNYQNNHVSSVHSSEKSIASTGTVKETGNPEQNEIPVQSPFQENISGISQHSVEDANIHEIHNSLKTDKLQKTVSDKIKTKRNNNSLSKQNSLKSRSASQELTSQNVIEDDLRKSKKKYDESKNQPVNIRRSSRQRFAPLERWRNEHLLYGYEEGELKLLGIDKGTKPDIAIIKLTAGKRPAVTTKKPKKAKLYDIVENKKVHINLLKKFCLVPWEPPSKTANDENSEDAYNIKRMIETNRFGSGYIQIKRGQEKPPQFMPHDDLTFILLNGQVEFLVEKNSYTLSAKDMCVVPRHCAYSIKNIGKVTSVLAYTVGQFKFLEREKLL